jgi:hypothetical protein
MPTPQQHWAEADGLNAAKPAQIAAAKINAYRGRAMVVSDDWIFQTLRAKPQALVEATNSKRILGTLEP